MCHQSLRQKYGYKFKEGGGGGGVTLESSEKKLKNTTRPQTYQN